MLKKSIALLIIVLAIVTSFRSLLPNSYSNLDTPDHKFSSARALVHLKEISKKPHFVGNNEHTRIRNYIIEALNNLGLAAQV